jgi:hypothetical protein
MHSRAVAACTSSGWCKTGASTAPAGRWARDGAIPTIQATRGGVELEVSGASLADAAGTIFARAMHSSRRRDRDEKR